MKEYYEGQFKKIAKEISDLWEVGKKSKAREKRLEEIELILMGIEAKEVLEEQIRKTRYYERLLEQNNISYLH